MDIIIDEDKSRRAVVGVNDKGIVMRFGPIGVERGLAVETLHIDIALFHDHYR